MKRFTNNIAIWIAILILSSAIFLGSCVPPALAGTLDNATTQHNEENIVTLVTTPTEPEKSIPNITDATSQTMIKSPEEADGLGNIDTASWPGMILVPTVGAEFPLAPRQYDKWTILDFTYEVYEGGNDYHFPWSLKIRNETEDTLELTIYIIHMGFHGWIGYVSEKPFILEAFGISKIAGEDVLGIDFYDNMLYIEEAEISIFIAEQ